MYIHICLHLLCLYLLAHLAYPVVLGVYLLDPKVRKIGPSRTNISNLTDVAG